jgi:MSHA biogenesis protein MshP
MSMKNMNISGFNLKGFSIVSAIFILVILALVGGFSLNLSTRMAASTSLSTDGIRAYYAAKSGLQWGIYQVVNTPASCPATTTLNFSQQGLDNFSTTVSCTATPITESSTTFNLFSLTSVASRGVSTDYDYVTRTLSVTAMVAANP